VSSRQIPVRGFQAGAACGDIILEITDLAKEIDGVAVLKG